MTSDDLHSAQSGSASSNPNPPAQSVTYAAVPSPWDLEETQEVPPQTTASEQADNRLELPDLKGLTPPSPDLSKPPEVLDLEQHVALLRKEEASLRADVDQLRAARSRLQDQLLDAQNSLGRLIQEGLKELEQRRKALQIAVEQLERRQERIRKEMQTTFAGVSQDVAIRVQSFKDYLVGSLQELAASAEELNLPMVVEPLESVARANVASQRGESTPTKPELGAITFQSQAQLIRELIDQYRYQPDYYGPAWQLRRTFEPIHADRVSTWFFTQGGRGAVRTLGSRLQNILVSAAVISILSEIYGDRLRAMVLAQSPERLGEWRRGLQDCLGINRADFGPERGVVLFEAPEALAMSAERTMTDGLMPLIIVDETEETISLSLLQFPLWLAFAPNPATPRSYDD